MASMTVTFLIRRFSARNARSAVKNVKNVLRINWLFWFFLFSESIDYPSGGREHNAYNDDEE